MEGLPYVDVDYCRFEDCGYQKPTRFYGSNHVLELDSKFCDGRACPGLLRDKQLKPGVAFRHRWHKGGGSGHVVREVAYHIPQGVIEYVSGLAPAPPEWPTVEDAPETPEMKMLRITLGDPEFLQALEEVRTWRIKRERDVQFDLRGLDSSDEEDESEEDTEQVLGDEEEFEIA